MAAKRAKLVELYSFLHADIRSGFGTVFQGVGGVLSLLRIR
jgi:hypothetical protein